MVVVCTTLGCGSGTPTVHRRDLEPRSVHEVGQVRVLLREQALFQEQGEEPEEVSGERSIRLWVRAGAVDSELPQVATTLAWAIAGNRLRAVVYPFATRFSWQCGEAQSLGDCMDVGLHVLRGAPKQIDIENLRERLVAERLEQRSPAPELQKTEKELLKLAFAEPASVRPLGSAARDEKLTAEKLNQFWATHYGAHNAFFEVNGFTADALAAIDSDLRSLRSVAARPVRDHSALNFGELKIVQPDEGYQGFVVGTSCTGVAARLRTIAQRLDSTIRIHTFDIRDWGLVVMGTARSFDAEMLQLIDASFVEASCSLEDPLLRWLVRSSAEPISPQKTPVQ